MSGVRAVQEQSTAGASPAGFVLGLDVGSSVIRCHVYDHATRICGSSAQKVTGERAVGQGRTEHPGSSRGEASGRVRGLRPACSHLQHQRALGPDRRAGSGQISELPPPAGLKHARLSCPG